MKKDNYRRQNCKGKPNNSMTIIPKALSYAWRPNNYRRQIKIKSLSDSGIKKILTTIPFAEKNSHTNIISIKDYCPNITVQVFKEKVLFIWKQERHRNIKKWFSISGIGVCELQSEIDFYKQKITSLLDSAAEMFKKQFQIEYLGLPIWVRYEDALKGDDFLDSLPSDAVIHAEHFKKVYADEVEFIGKTNDEPTVKMVEYIHNRIVERFTPAIAAEIKSVNNSIKAFSGDIFKWCEDNIQSVQDVFKHEDIIKYLSVDKKALVTEFLFKKFGGVE